MRSGHVVMDSGCSLISVDAGFSEIMQSDVSALVGRAVLDLTAPADRAECGEVLARLRATRRPFEISKRFMRDDGALVWVKNTVSMVGNGCDNDIIVATVSPIREPDAPRAPAVLLESARLLSSMDAERATLFDQSIFSNTAWNTILATYVAEAEGRAITIDILVDKLRLSQEQVKRWITVLIGQGVIEVETRETDAFAPKGYLLTAMAHRRIEEHLAIVGRTIGKRAHV